MRLEVLRLVVLFLGVWRARRRRDLLRGDDRSGLLPGLFGLSGVHPLLPGLLDTVPRGFLRFVVHLQFGAGADRHPDRVVSRHRPRFHRFVPGFRRRLSLLHSRRREQQDRGQGESVRVLHQHRDPRGGMVPDLFVQDRLRDNVADHRGRDAAVPHGGRPCLYARKGNGKGLGRTGTSRRRPPSRRRYGRDVLCPRTDRGLLRRFAHERQGVQRCHQPCL